MHESAVHVSRLRRDTSEEEKMLKKNPTKKPTNLIKQKPTSPIPLKSTTIPPSSHSDHIEADPGHHSQPSNPVPVDGNTFFAPEDVTLPPNSNSSVSYPF